MSQYESISTRLDDAPYLQPPPGKRYVRSFFFSRRVDAPLAQVHLIVRVALVLCLSAAQLRMMNSLPPDVLGALLLWVGGLALFVTSGMPPLVARVYLLITLPTLLCLFLTWLIFYPLPGYLLWVHPVYSGSLALGLAFWQPLWLLIVAGYFVWRRGFFVGILLASLISFLFAHFVTLPVWTFVHLAVFHPLTIVVTFPGLLVALTKAIGYSSMIFATMALVVSSRDIEVIGALRQLHVPQPVIFFLSTVSRALNLAFTDFEMIYQSQVARAINARPRTLFRRLLDIGSMAIPLVAMMIRRSSEIGDALLARGYSLRRAQTDFYETIPWRWHDWLLGVLCLVLLYLAVAPHPSITSLLLGG